MKRAYFITGTDTEVGKTVVTAVLGKYFQDLGLSVGVMKPVQCGGDDAAFLKKHLGVEESVSEINPFFARDPLSPHIALPKSQIRFQKQKVLTQLQKLQQKYDVVLVEGAGGLLVPITKNYLMVDLMKDLDIPIVVVSRLGLGTINHTLLTLAQLHEHALDVTGVIFNATSKRQGVPEKTNPQAVQQYGKVKILGSVPYFSSLKKLNARIQFDFPLPPKSKARMLQQWDQQYVWHPFTQMQDWLKENPLVIDQAKGNYLIDVEGRRYLDGVSSLWVNVHGHGHPTIDRALKDQINKLSHSTMLGLSNTPAVALAKKLVEITPKSLQKVFYSDNGSTSVEIGIKMAYQYWQNVGETKKTNIVHLKNSYHGDTLGSVSVGGIDLFHKVYRKLIFKTMAISVSESMQELESLLKTKHHTIAALVVEPLVQGAAGMIMWPKGVLKKMRALCTKYHVFLIVDEVATGFGRTGKMFACEHENVQPDILCLAKGITGGYLPLAATLTTDKIYQGFLHDYKDQKTFFHGHTYTGNPLACAAALASLQVFEKERVMTKIQPRIKSLSQTLKMFYNLRSVKEVRQLGLMVGIELVKDRVTGQPYPWEDRIGVRVCERVREHGVILRPLGNVIVLMPPLSITTKELKTISEATYQAIEEVTSL